jgi:predicted nucleotidyltransferase
MPSREIIEEYARIYRDREAARRGAIARRAAAIRRKLPEAAALLRERYGVRRVGVFGSLATGAFGEASDVDLYVDAVRKGAYFRAVAELTALLDADVDLVELEGAPESLAAHIMEEGQDVD